MKDLQDGTAVSGRYRNRRLGDFLKELDLTEGRSTGLSLIHKELSKNGSPPPIIETDEERTFFRVTIPIHPAFEGMEYKELSITAVFELLIQRLKVALSTSAQASDQASDQASLEDLEKMIVILLKLKGSEFKKEVLLQSISISVHSKNVQRYIDPLKHSGLIEKTIPDKPTSPKQQYRLTGIGKKMLE